MKMLHYFLGMVLVLSAFTAHADVIEDQPVSDYEYLDNASALYKFLNNYVVGLKFKGGLEGTTLDEKFEFEFKKAVVVSNLKISDSGVSYSVTHLIRHSNFELENGVRTGLHYENDRLLVMECEIAEKESTGNLLGYCRTTVNAFEDATGEVFAVRVTEITETSLVIEESQIGYSDVGFNDDDLKPIATKFSQSYSFDEDNFLQIDTTVSLYDVNPEFDESIDGYPKTLRRSESLKLYEIEGGLPISDTPEVEEEDEDGSN